MAGERILIVEDERAVARGLEYGLTSEGFTVLWADTGQRALELVRGQRSSPAWSASDRSEIGGHAPRPQPPSEREAA